MPRSLRRTGPRWDRLYDIAAAQVGHFTTSQAAGAGYSPQLLAKYLKNRRIRRIRRGIYRLVHFPAGEIEDLVVLWLWTGRAGVFSHETALSLHGLSDVMPARAQVTLPSTWKVRRLRTPGGIGIHFADLGVQERTWVGIVPVTTVTRTLLDCAAAGVAPDLIRDALKEAIDRGMADGGSLPAVNSYLDQFSSVPGRGASSSLPPSAGVANPR